MKESCEIIVLHHTKFQDNSIVLHTLSREFGRKSFLVKSIGGTSGKVMGLFLPMNILECEVRVNPRASLWQLSRISAKYPLNGIRSNLYKNTISLFLSEILYKGVKEGGLEQGLFEWCEEKVLVLDALKDGWSNFHLIFLMELCSRMGFAPDREDIFPFCGKNYDRIVKLMSLPVAEALIYPMQGSTRSEIAESLIKYLSFHTESSININSLGVLKEIFSDPD